jgi:small subunit ribosomal protein S17
MADEETTDNDIEQTADDAPAPEAEAPGVDAPVEAEENTAAPAPAAAEPVAVLTPKERRQSARAAKAAKVPARASRSPEERQAERVADRRKKAEIRRAGRARTKAKASHEGAAATPPREHVPGVQKVRQGVVVSDKADKTITVRIDTARRHRRYSKIVRTSRTLHAHDERNDANIGDTVIVREARPLSRTKRWRLVQVVERAK